MSKKVGKGKNDNDNGQTISEAEKKALEKLDQTHLLIEISIHKKRIEELQRDVYDQNQEIRKINEEQISLTLKMEKDLNEKQEQNVQLQAELDMFRKSADDKFIFMLEEKERRIKSILENNVNELKEKDRKIEELHAHVQKMSQSEEREEEQIKKIADQETKFRQQEYVHNDQMKKMEKNFFKQNQNLESVNKAKIDDIMRNADKLAEKKVKDSEERTKKENKKLKQDLEVHQKELEQMKREKVQMLEENKNFKKNFSLNQDGAIEYQSVNHQQATKIKKLKDKVEYLKNYISDEVSKYTKEIEFMKYQHQTKEQEHEYHIKSLKEQLQIRAKELKNVKALAQMILDQRSDIEQFFLQALDQVRAEMKKKLQYDKRSRLPEISQKSIITQGINASATIEENKNKYQNDKVDIRELDLEEKEKLLRILFSKMNQGIPANHWKSVVEKSQGENSTFRDQNFGVQQKEYDSQ